MNKRIFLDIFDTWLLMFKTLILSCVVLFIVELTILDFEHHSDSFHILYVIINKVRVLPCFVFPHRRLSA